MNDDEEDPIEDARRRIVRAVQAGAEIPTDAFDVLTEDLLEVDVVTTYLNVVDSLPSIQGDWWWDFGEQLKPPAPARDADADEAGDEEEDEDPRSVSDSDLLAIARSWVDFVSGNDSYRWDYPDYSVARVAWQDDEVWLVLRQDWDAGAEREMELVEGLRTEEEAEARIGKEGFIYSSDVTMSSALEMR